MVTDKDTVYYLWLTPDNDAHHRYAEVIRKLSRAYHSRLFEPHITLASGITGPEKELVARTADLSKQITRMMIEPLAVNYLNEFYRSLFLLVTPTAALVHANRLARKLFGLPFDETYMPHLSLFYGDLPVSEKEKIKGTLNSTLLAPFQVNTLVLFSTGNASDNWCPVQSFSLATKA